MATGRESVENLDLSQVDNLGGALDESVNKREIDISQGNEKDGGEEEIAYLVL